MLKKKNKKYTKVKGFNKKQKQTKQKKKNKEIFRLPHLSCVFLPSCVVPEAIYGHLRVLTELRTNQLNYNPHNGQILSHS